MSRRVRTYIVLGWLAFASGGYFACSDDPRNKLLGDLGTTPKDAAGGIDTTAATDAEDQDVTLDDADDTDVTIDSPAADTATSDVRPDVRDSGPDVRDTGPDVRDAGPDVRDAPADG